MPSFSRRLFFSSFREDFLHYLEVICFFFWEEISSTFREKNSSTVFGGNTLKSLEKIYSTFFEEISLTIWEEIFSTFREEIFPTF
jgi:hypothetical protein